MKVPFNDLSRIHNPIREEIDKAIKTVIDNHAFILGQEVRNFEEEFALYNGFNGEKNAAGVDSGMSALELIMKSLNIGAGDEVITAANTFNATVSSICIAGANPVLVDVDESTSLIDPEKISEKITRRTKAIMPVHLYGQQSKIERIVEIADKHGITVIEDACQAHGSLRHSRSPGSLTNSATYSFYPGKNLGAFGDAGLVMSDDENLIEKIKKLRNYGQSKKYYHDVQGFNKRLDGIQAAILRVKLRFLDEWNDSRRKNAQGLIERLRDMHEVELPETLERNTHTYHIFAIKTNDREELQQYLSERNIETGIHYPVPIHLQECFRHLNISPGSFPITEKMAQRTLSLPLFPFMREEELDYIAESIRTFYKTKK